MLLIVSNRVLGSPFVGGYQFRKIRGSSILDQICRELFKVQVVNLLSMKGKTILGDVLALTARTC